MYKLGLQHLAIFTYSDPPYPVECISEFRVVSVKASQKPPQTLWSLSLDGEGHHTPERRVQGDPKAGAQILLPAC